MKIAPDGFVRDGLVLHVDDAGGPGHPVIFQHGLCGDARQVAEVFPSHPAFRRVTLECRGHGGSAPGDPGKLSIATFSDDLASLIETLDVGPVVVGGVSMGAALALRLAVHRPDLVRALILVRPAWVTRTAPCNMRPNAEAGRLLARLPPDRARAAFLESPTAAMLRAEAPDNLASLLGFFDRDQPAATAALLQAISADGPGVTVEQVRVLRSPALVLGTERDVVHPFGHAEALAALIPRARLVALTSKAESRARHTLELQAALASFLKDIT